MNSRLIAFGAAGVAAFMLALSLFSAPLYDTFCRITGFGGTTRIAQAAPDRISDRQMQVRFDANANAGALRFRPLQSDIDVALGEHGLAFYEVSNTSDQPVTAIASYNVTPFKAGSYFNKLECFCFREQVFPAGETKTLPVVFFVSPDLEEESDLDDVRTITLSYTFFPASAGGGAAK